MSTRGWDLIVGDPWLDEADHGFGGTQLTSSLGFGSVAAGQTGTQIITVSNVGQSSTGLLLSNASILPATTAFSIGPISCSNGATSLPTTLPTGGVCVVTISYTAPASGPPPSATLTFTDNAALSNLTSTPATGGYIQSISLNGSGTTAPTPVEPPSTIPITINESIQVTDTVNPPPPSPVFVAVGSKVGSLILNATAGTQQYVATVSLSNAGNIGSGLQVTGATLNGVSSSSVPISLSMGPGGTSNITLNFPSSAGASGARVILTVKGTYSTVVLGGSTLNGSWTGSFRVTLPVSSQ
jgi:hypothetical protein